MAEEQESESTGGGGLSGFKAILTKKVGGIPVWAIGLVGIAVIAYILKKRSDAKAASGATDSSAASSVAGQAFPYGQPMNYSSDVYINQPTAPPATPGTTPQIPIASLPKNVAGTGVMVSALQGWNVNQWIKDLNAQGIPITYDELIADNPGLPSHLDSSHNFTSQGNYQILNTHLPAAK